MRRILIITAAMAVAVGCGGSKKEAEEGGGGGGSGATWDPAEREANPCGGDMVSPECVDEVSHLFARKRPAISVCYSDAVQAGKLSRKQGGRVAVQAKISPAGRATHVEIMDSSTLKSDIVNECIITMIKSWDIPKPNVTFEFTFAYDFLAWE